MDGRAFSGQQLLPQNSDKIYDFHQDMQVCLKDFIQKPEIINANVNE
jgi:hypothetical protein